LTAEVLERRPAIAGVSRRPSHGRLPPEQQEAADDRQRIEGRSRAEFRFRRQMLPVELPQRAPAERLRITNAAFKRVSEPIVTRSCQCRSDQLASSLQLHRSHRSIVPRRSHRQTTASSCSVNWRRTRGTEQRSALGHTAPIYTHSRQGRRDQPAYGPGRLSKSACFAQGRRAERASDHRIGCQPLVHVLEPATGHAPFATARAMKSFAQITASVTSAMTSRPVAASV
jgi:hypothetical protein